MRQRSHDALVVALVVAMLGVTAAWPRGERSTPPVATATAAPIPATPCEGLTAERKPKCLAVARALLAD